MRIATTDAADKTIWEYHGKKGFARSARPFFFCRKFVAVTFRSRLQFKHSHELLLSSFARIRSPRISTSRFRPGSRLGLSGTGPVAHHRHSAYRDAHSLRRAGKENDRHRYRNGRNPATKRDRERDFARCREH